MRCCSPRFATTIVVTFINATTPLVAITRRSKMGIVTRAIRNISRRKMRALLVIIALGFSLAMMISLPPGIIANQTAAQNVINRIQSNVNNLGSNLTVAATEIDCSLPATIVTNWGGNGGGPSGPDGGGGFFQAQIGGPAVGASSAVQYTTMNQAHYSDIGSIQDVNTVIPILQVNEPEGQYEYQIEGIPLNATLISTYPILPTNITSGRTLQANENGAVVISEENANHWGVSVGGTVNILGKSFKVVGVHGTSGIVDVATTYMSLEDAQAITNNAGNATIFKVFADNSNNVGKVQTALSIAHPDFVMSTSQSLVSQLSGLQSANTKQLQDAQNTMNATQSTAIVEISVAVAAGGAIVLFLMLYTVRERTKEIGTLKAIGASNGTIMGQFMLEGVILSLVAGFVGIAIGTVGATSLAGALLPHVSSPFAGGAAVGLTSISVSISPELMLIGLGVAVLLGSLGSLYPAWRAAKTRPSEAMRYE